MKPSVLGTILASCAVWLAFSQSAEAPPKFEAADVHVSAKIQNPFVRTGPVRGGRYEIKYATMVDLIRTAYSFDADKILGGPSWLEMDRFDVIAKVPADTTPDTQKLMLQSLLADRFRLAVHKDSKPLPTYALVAGKKPQLKEAEGTEESGCKPASAGAGPDSMRIMVGAAVMGGAVGGSPQTLTLGPGGTIQYACRNMTMKAFTEGLRSMMGASLGRNPILEETGLTGRYNFDVRWSMLIFGPGMESGDRVTVFEAMEKQLGLKLEERQVPTPVMVVDSVNQKPSDNPPGTAEVLPAIPVPTEFEVASVKPADPVGRGMRYQTQPGGGLNAQGMPLRSLVSQAFSINAPDQLVGLPGWADTERFDIIAKAASEGSAPAMDREAMAPMLRALLVERFKMTYHTEDRQLPAYALTGSKPKMKKADPASRTSCKDVPPPPGGPPGTRVMSCQNITMAQFVDRLRGAAMELSLGVADATGIEGGWDFSLTYNMNFGMPMMMARGGGDAVSAGGGPAAPDPSGGLSIFEAVEKQLGLKLEKQKRSVPVIVIDHIEQKPTEN